jgi:hypothetical protein
LTFNHILAFDKVIFDEVIHAIIFDKVISLIVIDAIISDHLYGFGQSDFQ